MRLERNTRGLRLRRAGMLWDEIARASQEWPEGRFSGAAHAYNEVMKLARGLPKQDAEEWRQTLTERAEEIYRIMAGRARAGDVNAAQAALRALSQLRSLHVPEQPQHVEVTVVGEFEAAMRDLEREMELRQAARPVRYGAAPTQPPPSGPVSRET